MNYKGLYISLCDDAYPNEKGGRRKKGRKPNPLACAECESPCEWGLELLKTIDVKEYKALLCGADCEVCRQPCNLRRVTYMRGIKWVRTKKKKGWMYVAMRPYTERHGRK